MRIDWTLLCRAAEVGAEGVNITGGGVGLVGLRTIPGELEAAVWTHLEGAPEEFVNGGVLRFQLLNARSDVLGSHTVEFGKHNPHPDRPPGRATAFDHVTEIAGLAIPEPGKYRLEVMLIPKDEQDTPESRVLAFTAFEEIKPEPDLAARIAEVENASTRVFLYPPGLLAAPEGSPNAASAMIYDSGVPGRRAVGRGSTPSEAFEEARKALG